VINKFIHTDALTGMESLESDSIPLTVTSPPFDGARDFGGHEFNFKAIAQELWRITRPGGILCWQYQDQIFEGSETCTSATQTLFFKGIGFRLYQTLFIVSYSFRRSTRRYYRMTSTVQAWSKGRPDVINLLKDRPNRNAGRMSGGGLTYRSKEGLIERRSPKINAPIGIRGDCWVYDVGGCKTTTDRYAFSHPALMPEALARDLIESYSVRGDVVLDPMAGAATTLKMALLSGRKYLGFEPWDLAFGLAERRMKDAHASFRANLNKLLSKDL
jgi:DNA modification methylase